MNHIKYCNWHLVVVVCVAMAMFASCGSRGTGGAAEDARRLATDSLLSSVKDVDSLAAIVSGISATAVRVAVLICAMN